MNGKLERWLNELAKDPEMGKYLQLVSSHVTSIVRHMGLERSWATVVRVARRAVEIEEGG